MCSQIQVYAFHAQPGELPIIEAKSAGDFTDANKRRKEEAAKALPCVAHTVMQSTTYFFCVATLIRAVATKLQRASIGCGSIKSQPGRVGAIANGG